MRSVIAWALAALTLFLCASTAQANVLGQDPFAAPALAARADLPDEFVEETAFEDLIAPSSVAFAADGRVFVAQLDGVIKVFDGLDDTTPRVYADLSTNVAWHGDRGLLGMTLDPEFTTGRPYVYVLYTYDAAIGGTAPRWEDVCPDPPGAERDGCVVSGRLSKILPDGTEQPLITDEWCQQYSSHSVGDVKFGPDGALYVTAGDGASYTFADYGQDGAPVNPCGDAPTAPGVAMTPPTAEGGALRSQDARTKSDPTGLSGAMLRLDPDTGAPLPDNPGTGSVNDRRIVAYGFRNPFRLAFRPGTTDAYVADVGWLAWEEVDRVPDVTSKVRNYGWPCYEGAGRQSGYEAIDLNLCRNLYNEGPNAVEPPLYTYHHNNPVTPGEDCALGSSAVSALTFYDGATFPAAYKGALFFGDYSRNCIWVMFPDANGIPNPATRQVFVEDAQYPVDLEIGPGGDLYYADVGLGTIQRIRAVNPNQAPTARFTASPTAGDAPLTVQFDAGGSTDPNDDALDYAWDLDGDGEYDDSTAEAPTHTYVADGNITARLRVTDPSGASSTATDDITVGTPPTVTITGPADRSTYAVGDTVAFAGTAHDASGEELPVSRLLWSMDLNHCSALNPTNCHVHHIQNHVGVRSGTFSYPDHEYPSYVTLTLTATLPSGLRAKRSVRVDPKTVELTLDSEPSALTIAVGGEASTTPFTRTVARGSTIGIAAPPSQPREGFTYDFTSWSDGGQATHQITADADATYTARYTEASCPTREGLVGAWGFDEPSGATAYDTSGRGNSGTISGATRVEEGRFGGALRFDGLDDVVTVPDANSLDLVAGMTLSAWVNPSQLGNSWRTALLKERPGGMAYALYAHNGSGPAAHVATPIEFEAHGDRLPLNAWSYVTAVYDGTTVRLYVNGEEVSSSSVAGDLVVSNGALRIGGNSVWAEWFAGAIDDVRVYDRALSGAEVRVDMTRPVTCVDAPEPPALAVTPTSVYFSAQQGGAAPAAKTLAVTNSGGGTMAWTASSDAPWLSVSPASGTNSGSITVTPTLTGLAPGTHAATVTVSAAGANGSPRAIPVSITIEAAPVLAVAPAQLTFSATQGDATIDPKAINVANQGAGTLDFTAEADVAWLSVDPGAGSAPRTIAVTPTLDGLAPGTHLATVTVRSGSASRTVPVSFTVTARAACPTPAGLVGAWGFDETGGSAVEDASSAGNDGTLSGATRTASGRFGRALAFDGAGDWVTIADDESLDLTTGMTLSAWVNPETVAGLWRTVALKERGEAMSYALYAGTDTAQAAGFVATPREFSAKGTANLATGVWTHLATTYDGTTVRLFVNGVQVATRAVSGAAAAGDGPLRVGGNGTWDEWFKGLIDEVRVYERALPADEIQADMARPVTCASAPEPVLAVSPSALSFNATEGGSSPAAKTIEVSNAGDGTLSWSVSDDAGWLSVAPASGTNAGTVTVTPALGALAAGTHTASVTVTAGASAKTIPVTFTVEAPAAELSVTPASLAFDATEGGADPAAKTLAITNAGGGSLAWSVDEDAAWLTVTPASGDGAGTVTVRAALGALAPGTYTTDVVVSAGAQTKTIPVTFTVGARPAELAVAPAALAFNATEGGASPAAKTFAVSNAGGGSLSWTASESASWLAISPASGTGAGTVTVTPTLGALAAGTYTADVTVTAGAQAKTVAVTFTVAPVAQTTGLVAAYGFEETGTTTTDSSDNGNLGTISGATRVATGRFGSALAFDGVNDAVAIPNASSLNPTTGITMSAWVNSEAAGGNWRTVLMKEQPGNLIYALYANEGSGKPSGHAFVTSDVGTSAPSNLTLNTWVHLASTWDGTTLRLFVNGVQVSSQALTGTLRTSTGSLRIGGNAVWPEWFKGRIDEVRLYSRALSAAEIQGDMGRPVVGAG